MNTLEDRIKEIIATELKVSLAKVTPDKTIVGDLWADSMAVVELTSALEEAFGIEVPEQEMPRLRTVGDIIHYIGGQVARAAPQK